MISPPSSWLIVARIFWLRTSQSSPHIRSVTLLSSLTTLSASCVFHSCHERRRRLLALDLWRGSAKKKLYVPSRWCFFLIHVICVFFANDESSVSFLVSAILIVTTRRRTILLCSADSGFLRFASAGGRLAGGWRCCRPLLRTTGIGCDNQANACSAGSMMILPSFDECVVSQSQSDGQQLLTKMIFCDLRPAKGRMEMEMEILGPL